MALSLSTRSQNIKPSLTLAIDAKAKAMMAAGEDVISFGAGEPDFDTPEYIRDAAKNALDLGKTRYTPVAGTLELRTEIVKKLERDNALIYDPRNIIVCNGAKQAVFNALAAIVNPGDEVLIPAPCWVSYPEMVRMVDGVPVLVKGRKEDAFVVSADQIAPFVTDKTKALILNSPNNPNGCVWPADMLASIARLAVERGFYVISDEIYEKLIYDGQTHVSIASLGEDIKEQTVVVNGLSKSFAMTGWRIGYAAGPRPIIKAMTAFQSHSTSAPNSMAQYAAAVALTNGERDIRDMVAQFDSRRRLMHQMIQRIDGLDACLPGGAFYIMLNIEGLLGGVIDGRKITDAMTFAEVLLTREHVAVVPGTPFGDDKHVRLSYATSSDRIREGMTRIERFAACLRAPAEDHTA